MKTRFLAVAALTAALCACPARAALPLTPSTTYVASSTPAIKAQDLNDLQKYVAGLYSALYSVKALIVDGTGGAGVTPVAGTVTVSSTVSGFNNSAPYNTASVPWGQQSKEQVVLGAARCSASAGTISSCGGFNIKSVSHLGGGLFRVEFNSAGPNALRHVATATAENASPTLAVISAVAISGGAYRVDVQFYDLGGAGVTTTNFHVLAVGG